MPTEVKTKKKDAYIEGIGRRKEATARVRVTLGGKTIHIEVNGKKYDEYFTVPELRHILHDPLALSGITGATITAKVYGGGIRAQAEAIRLGIARALIVHDTALRGPLKQAKFLRRDARVVERKKFGLKKARRAPQWSKR
jgi:small subunit ribosomal protein S9